MKLKLIISLAFVLFLGCHSDDNMGVSNWEKLSIPIEGTLTNILDIDFYNDNIGACLIHVGNILITKDGGETWQEINVVSDESLISINVLNGDEIFVGRHRFFKSVDGGENFIELGQGQIDFYSAIVAIHFFNSGTGIILKGGSSIYKTIDGGVNWTVKYLQFGSSHLMEIADNQTLYLAGGRTYDNVTYGEMHKSIDGGETWQEINLPPEIDNWDITAMNSLTKDIIFVSTIEHKIFKTLDGGLSWEKISTLNFGSVSDIDFENENRGYLISYKKIYKTVDGGVNWTTDFESDEEMFDIERTPNNSVFVTGRNGLILKKKQ